MRSLVFAVLGLALFAVVCAGAGLKARSLLFNKDGTLSSGDLWLAVHFLCEPAAAVGLSFPCLRMAGEHHGTAILRVSAGHILAVPVKRIAGIESPELLAPDVRNHWQDAWEARADLARDFASPPGRDWVGLAVNSIHGRTQDQFHIHVACLRRDVRDVLAASESKAGPGWIPLAMPVPATHYRVLKIYGADLSAVNVLSLLPPDIRSNPHRMGLQTIVVAGARFSDGRDGFYVLDDESFQADPGTGELLLDEACGAYAGKGAGQRAVAVSP